MKQIHTEKSTINQWKETYNSITGKDGVSVHSEDSHILVGACSTHGEERTLTEEPGRTGERARG